MLKTKENTKVFILRLWQELCCYSRFEFKVNFNFSGIQRNSSRVQNDVKSSLKKFFFFHM